MQHTSSPTITHKLRSQLHLIVGFTDLFRLDVEKLGGVRLEKHLTHLITEFLDHISEIKQAAFKLEEIVKELRDAAVLEIPKIENEEEESEEEKFEFTADATFDANDSPSARP